MKTNESLIKELHSLGRYAIRHTNVVGWWVEVTGNLNYIKGATNYDYIS